MKISPITFDECVLCYLFVIVVIVCRPSSDATSSTSTTTIANESDSDSKSKPWLSRMFKSSGGKATVVVADNGKQQQQAGGEFNASKHFDLKNVRQDFNRPLGGGAAPGVRVTKTGRKIR